MKLTDLTTPEFLCSLSMACPAVLLKGCSLGGCPGVLQAGDELIIIGKFMSFRDRYQAGIEGRVGDDESAVIIDAKLVIEALKAYLNENPDTV